MIIGGTTVSRYVANRTLRGIGLALIIVTAIITLVDCVEGSRNIGSDADITFFQLLGLTLLKVPKLIEQTIPFIVLFGVMGALYGMNRRSDMIGILWSTVGNPIATNLMTKYETKSAELTGEFNSDEIWLRDGSESFQRIIHARSISDKTLTHVTLYEMAIETDGTTRFARRYDAQKAELLGTGYWKLTNIVENAPNEDTKRVNVISLPTNISLEQLQDQTRQSADPPFWEIRKEIEANRRAGFSARPLELQFNRLLSLPFLLVAMTFIAAGVSMSLARQGGTIRLLIIGSVMGFAVFFADSVISAFGEVAILPVSFAAWAVPALVLLSSVTYLAKIEDG